MFFYESWPVFKNLVELRTIAHQLSEKYHGRGLSSDLNQLARNTSSGVLNVGEGAKATKKGTKLERYGTALASIGEANANLIVLSIPIQDEPLIARGRDLCSNISRDLTNIMRSVERDWR
jgi:hypothetical protein